MAKLSVDQALLKAKSHVKKGEFEEAQKLYQVVLQAFPKNKRAQQGLAALNKPKQPATSQGPPQETINKLVNLYNQGQLTAVVEQAQGLTEQYPKAFIIWNILGIAHKVLGKTFKASEAFKKVTELNPTYADGFSNLGVTLQEQGKLEEAIEAYEKALAIKPNYAEAYNNMGNALKDQGKLEEAIEAYEKALALKPDYAEAYYNMGTILQEQGKLEEAREAYEKALAIKPNYAEAHNNIGTTLQEQGKLEQAREAYEKALALKPDYAEAYYNMGATLHDQGKLNEAIEIYNKALSLKPDYAEAYYNSSLVYNLKGEIQKGLELNEYRFYLQKVITRAPREKLSWNGFESIEGKKFFVYEEQGLGDIIQFCRYLPILVKQGATVTFMVRKKLHALLSTLGNEIILVDTLPDESHIDFEAPLMSLPHLLNTSLETIPSLESYLSADYLRVVSWGKLLGAKKFKIGICWQGSKSKIDIGRSFSLSLFEGISKLPNVELVSLHKGEGEKQIQDIQFDLTTCGSDFDVGQDAFLDTAAVIVNCDLIITSDTAVAHLAGSLGCETWLILKYVPDWRWMLNRPDSPWYPTMTLYRQKTPGNWEDVFTSVEQKLLSKLNEGKKYE